MAKLLQFYIISFSHSVFPQVILESFPNDNQPHVLQGQDVEQTITQMSFENTATTSSQHLSQTISNETTASASDTIFSISDMLQGRPQQQFSTPSSSARLLSQSESNINVFSVKFLHSWK